MLINDSASSSFKIALKCVHLPSNFMLSIFTFPGTVWARKLICKSIYFCIHTVFYAGSRNIRLPALLIAYLFIVSKLCTTDSNILNIAIPWFRLTLVDPGFRVLFHQFWTCIIALGWIRLNYISPLELINKYN